MPGPRPIAFGYHDSWAWMIARAIDHARFVPAFAPLDALDPDRFDALLPLDLPHYDELARAAPPPGKAIRPDPRLIDLCDDKLACVHALDALGFGAHLPALLDRAPPGGCVEKPRRGVFGSGVRLAEPGAEAAPGAFLQALVPGRAEYALHLLRAGGRLRFARLVRYRMASDRAMRSATCVPEVMAFVDPTPLLPLAGRLLAALDYEGTACINLKLAGDTPMILEINPRFGGSLVHDINGYVSAYLEALAG